MSTSDGSEFAGTDSEPVADRLDALFGRAAGPVIWDALTPERAAEHWHRLRAWVLWFRARFGFDHRVVPPCWYRHESLVELLSALHDHWRAAYDPFNSPTAASEWHRVLAQLEPRLRDWSARTGCTPAEHRPDVIQRYPDDQAEWAQHLRDDVVRRAEQSRVIVEVGR